MDRTTRNTPRRKKENATWREQMLAVVNEFLRGNITHAEFRSELSHMAMRHGAEFNLVKTFVRVTDDNALQIANELKRQLGGN